jgi:membrane protein YdbS with pleckstrin-like domain
MLERLPDPLAGVAAVLWNALWIIALGLVVLWAFFLVMGAVSLGDPVWVTVVMGTLAVLAAIHFVHVRRLLGDHAHDDIARRVHMLRERRGF